CTTGTRRSQTCNRLPRCPRAGWWPTSSPPSPASTRSWVGWTVDGTAGAAGVHPARPTAGGAQRVRGRGCAAVVFARSPGPAGGRGQGDHGPLPQQALGPAAVAVPRAGRGFLPDTGGPRVLR